MCCFYDINSKKLFWQQRVPVENISVFHTWSETKEKQWRRKLTTDRSVTADQEVNQNYWQSKFLSWVDTSHKHSRILQTVSGWDEMSSFPGDLLFWWGCCKDQELVWVGVRARRVVREVVGRLCNWTVVPLPVQLTLPTGKMWTQRQHRSNRTRPGNPSQLYLVFRAQPVPPLNITQVRGDEENKFSPLILTANTGIENWLKSKVEGGGCLDKIRWLVLITLKTVHCTVSLRIPIM